jgi:hypothetical protein
LTRLGFAVLKFSIICFVSWRFPATSRTLSVTGADTVIGGAVGAVVGAVEGAPEGAGVLGAVEAGGAGVAGATVGVLVAPGELHAETTIPAARMSPSRRVNERSCMNDPPTSCLSTSCL